MYCKNCDKKLENKPGTNKLNPIRIFCNNGCATRYNSRKRYYLGTNTKLERNKYNELMLKNYYENKKLWHSRVITRRLLKSLKYKEQLIKPSCFICDNTHNLEIHHEVYNTKYSEIIDDILSNKIYYLCKNCHNNKRIKV